MRQAQEAALIVEIPPLSPLVEEGKSSAKRTKNNVNKSFFSKIGSIMKGHSSSDAKKKKRAGRRRSSAITAKETMEEMVRRISECGFGLSSDFDLQPRQQQPPAMIEISIPFSDDKDKDDFDLSVTDEREEERNQKR